MDIGFVWDEAKYQTVVRENPPDPAKIQRGLEAREQRRKAATPKTVVGIEDDIIAEFKQLVPQEQEYRRLINQALREWLIAKDVKELVRTELQKVVCLLKDISLMLRNFEKLFR
jgi:hypothetical protein